MPQVCPQEAVVGVGVKGRAVRTMVQTWRQVGGAASLQQVREWGWLQRGMHRRGRV